MPRFDFAVPANPLELEKDTPEGWRVQVVRAPLPSPVQCGASCPFTRSHQSSPSFRPPPPRFPPLPCEHAPEPLNCTAQSGTDALLGELEDVAARLEDDPLLLAEPANFDPLYSAVRHFGALGAEARDRTQEVIGEALKGATRVCKRTINSMGCSDDELAERRQLLRLAAFLQSWLVREAERRLKIQHGLIAHPWPRSAALKA